MSEDAAYRRSKAARLVRDFPELHEMVAKGEIHLTGLLMIGPYLGSERHAEILARARFRSKREIGRLIARIDPKPEVPALVEPIGPEGRGRATHRAFVESLAGPVRELPLGQRPEDWTEATLDLGPDEHAELAAAESVPSETPAEPLPEVEEPLRYRVQFTANQEYVELLSEAFDLLSHDADKPDLPGVQLRAMRELVRQLKKRKRAAADRPRGSTHAPAREAALTSDSAPARRRRHIPAAVERAVRARDGDRCAYRDRRGHRCRETRWLEIHHRHAHAFGGPPTVANLEVRCRAHNTQAAEEDFGREHMDWVRGIRDAPRGPSRP